MQTKNNNSNQADDKEQSLSKILDNLQTNEFTDPQFPHIYENIYHSSTPLHQIEQVLWMPCEELYPKSFYTNGEFTLRQLMSMNLLSIKVNHALVLIKFFLPKAFQKLVQQRQLNYKFRKNVIKHLYCFQVFEDKQPKRVHVDSYVPVSEVRNKQLFAENLKGCIFPCLIQKLLAKICKGYHNISQLKQPQIIELFTSYPIQRVKLKQFFGQSRQEDYLLKIQDLIRQKTINKKSLVFFRTRKNDKLLSFGLRVNQSYLIMGLEESSFENEELLIRFLQLPQSAQNTLGKVQWIGKFSKYRAQNNVKKIGIGIEQLQDFENFMSVRDLIKVSKQLVILHNTLDYHIISETIPLNKYQNLTQSYQLQNTLIEQNIKSQFIDVKQISQTSVSPNSKIVSVQYDDFNEQRINQTDFQENSLLLVGGCMEVSLDSSKSVESIAKNMLVNLRISFGSGIIEGGDVMLGRMTVILAGRNQNAIITSKNVPIKLNYEHYFGYFDILLQLDQIQVKKSEKSLRLFVFFDMQSSPKFVSSDRVKLRTTIFERSTRRQILVRNKSQKIEALSEIVSDELFPYLRSLISDTNSNHQIQEQEIQIKCKQLVDKLNLGLIYIKLKQQHPNKNDKPKTYTVKIDINTKIMIKNGVYLLSQKGSGQNCTFYQEKHTISYRIQLSNQHNEFMLVFRINFHHQLRGQQKEQGKKQKFIQFPPVDSVKISRVFEATI